MSLEGALVPNGECDWLPNPNRGRRSSSPMATPSLFLATTKRAINPRSCHANPSTRILHVQQPSCTSVDHQPPIALARSRIGELQ